MRKFLNINFDIYDLITNKIISYFEKTLDFDEVEKEKLYLGIISILINVVKTSFICLIALFIGYLKETLFMIFLLFCLRSTAAGLHAKSNIMCTIISLLSYIGGSYLSINFPINTHAFIICILLTVLLYKYSPADTSNRPILGSDLRKKLKIQSLFTAIILLIFNLLILNTKILNLTMYAMLCQVISISPLTYKLLKRSYNNYEKFEE